MPTEQEQALVAMKEKHRMQLQSTLSCIEMFLAHRKDCGVATDAQFIVWLTKHLQQDKQKGEALFRAFEKQFPD